MTYNIVRLMRGDGSVEYFRHESDKGTRDLDHLTNAIVGWDIPSEHTADVLVQILELEFHQVEHYLSLVGEGSTPREALSVAQNKEAVDGNNY